MSNDDQLCVDKATPSVVVSELRSMLQAFNEDLGVHINDDQRYRLGKVLTVIDAAISDPEQRKAIKDLISNDWWGTMRLDKPGGSRMSDPHTDIRGICLALGFELYPPTNTEPSNDQPDREGYAAERYKKIARDKSR